MIALARCCLSTGFRENWGERIYYTTSKFKTESPTPRFSQSVQFYSLKKFYLCLKWKQELFFLCSVSLPLFFFLQQRILTVLVLRLLHETEITTCFSVNPPFLSAQKVLAVADFVLVLEETEMLKTERCSQVPHSAVASTWTQRNNTAIDTQVLKRLFLKLFYIT